MEEETNIETTNSSNGTEEVATVETTETETTEQEVDVEKLKEQNAKLFERAKKAEGYVKDSEGKWVKKQRPKAELQEQKPVQPSAGSIYEQVSLLKNIEQDEMEDIESQASDLGVDVIKFIKSGAGKTYLNQIRAKKKSENASESIPGKSPVFKKFTQDDIGKMSAEELAKILPHAE